MTSKTSVNKTSYSVHFHVMQFDEGWRGAERGGGLIKVSSLSVLLDKHFKKLCR